MNEAERNINDLIDSYLMGTLTGRELKEFEEKLKTDEKLSDQIAEQKVLLSNLKFYNRRIKLKGTINEIDQEMEFEKSLENTIAQPKRGITAFFNRNFTTISVAASVAVVTVLGTIFTTEYLKSFEKQQASNYRLLRRDVEQIKKSQQLIIEDLEEEDKDTPHPFAQFNGTGIALTANGYILTSYHVIKGGDSILVENDRFKQQKAKVVFEDKAHDLAIIKIIDEDFKLGNPIAYALRFNPADLGETVFTLGFPKDEIVYNEGSISSNNGYRGDSSAYQISIPVNPGNSGGPLLDEKGNLLGIISGKQSETEGVSFAIKSELISDLIKAIPADSLKSPLLLPKWNYLKGMTRPQQIKKIMDCVFLVKVYN